MKQIAFIPASNERLDNAVFSEALTTFAAGLKPADALEALDFIAPPVRSARRFEYRKFGKGAFLTEDAGGNERPVGGEFKRVEYSGEIVQAKCPNKGLSVVLDKDELMPGDEELYTQWLIQRILRTDYAAAVKMLQTAAGSATSSAWSGSSKVAPDAELLKLANSVLEACGVRANRMLIGTSAWAARLGYYEGSQTVSSAAANLTPDQLKGKLALEGLLVPEVVADFGSGKQTVAAAAEVVAFIGQTDGMRDDPSTLKRFWAPATGGGQFGVFREEKAKTLILTVECYTLIAQTGAGAAKRLTVS